MTVEEAMLLRMFHECACSNSLKSNSKIITQSPDDISLGNEINKKACKHFYYISSRIQKEVSKMPKFKRVSNSWDFSHASFSLIFLDNRYSFYTSTYTNNMPKVDIIYFLFTEELFTIPAAKLIDGRVPIFESIHQVPNHSKAQVLNLKKKWKSIYW